ncbi:hypothetical protein B0H13DRAFT_1920880 [Mycena leptocephala]|nr:hypothetical protein B0H13DRAFT_1920880 [Mycena leptocephala]
MHNVQVIQLHRVVVSRAVLPESKREKYLAKLDTWVEGGQVSRKEVENLVWTLNHCALVAPDTLIASKQTGAHFSLRSDNQGINGALAAGKSYNAQENANFQHINLVAMSHLMSFFECNMFAANFNSNVSNLRMQSAQLCGHYRDCSLYLNLEVPQVLRAPEVGFRIQDFFIHRTLDRSQDQSPEGHVGMDEETGGTGYGSELGARNAEREEGMRYAKLGDIKGWSDNAVLFGVGDP